MIDKCERCAGLWFDQGEAVKVKDERNSVTLDDGDAYLGQIYNEITKIDCPRCDKTMESVNDPKQPHIQYEVCQEHGGLHGCRRIYRLSRTHTQGSILPYS